MLIPSYFVAYIFYNILRQTLAHETAEGNFNDAAGAGSHGMGSHSLQSGAWCNLVQNARTEKLEIKAVVQVYRSLFCLSVLLDS